MDKWALLDAARVPARLKPQAFGPWVIERMDMKSPTIENLPEWAKAYLRMRAEGYSVVTFLKRFTVASLHLETGETVMDDSARELKRHLPIWLAAEGRVLVTGLGLGCTVRGLLAKPEVEHITVVEIDRQILRVVGHEFEGNRRVELVHADATRWDPGRQRFDFGWHDLWFEGDGLQPAHLRLVMRLWDRVGKQGAWGLPRWVKRHLGWRVLH